MTLNPEDEKTEITVINIDHSLAYLGYNKDFGPLNLGQLHSFCTQVKQEIDAGKTVLHHCTTHFQKQANAVFLACSY